MKVEDLAVFVGFDVSWCSPYVKMCAHSCSGDGFVRPRFINASAAVERKGLQSILIGQVVAVIDRHLFTNVGG